ncbi:hypothetical protein ACFQ4M_13120 [Thauera mechernichensis]|uniref:Restriction endonuclease type IV Mrr domain-containing protein n=1 Tax=Thauera mechernichensis TaxID=82788 RepID=A0ABW3WH25_9RHOO|nr:hypothetical protein [Thauera mechernichensis]MDG3063690.1 hypothetical protein [Thauera mechernichensis]
MRVSEYFKLGKTQAYLDFVDVPIDTDIEVFVDPTALRTLTSSWGSECASLVQYYFEAVLNRMKAGKDFEAQQLVSSLSERNEFHLGFSSGKSRGHGFGTKSAESVWGALSKSKASKSGLLKDLEDTCLLIEGIGRDMVSDAVCNIIRGPLIKYTQDICSYYGIPLTPNVVSGPIWNSHTETWENKYVSLPITSEGKLILVPKIFVRHRLSYEYREYYQHYLLPEMQHDEMQRNTGLVELLTDGRKRVTKKKLKERYGDNKLAVVEQTLRFPHVLDEYREAKERSVPPPLDHEQFAEIETIEAPKWDDLTARLHAIPTGNAAANEYEELIEEIFSALFYPSLCNPRKQHEIHDGRKRIDITYTNEARGGFFAWLSQHYPCAFVFIECKNYGKEVGNPEVDQLSGRFSPSRGQVGLLVCRSVDDPGRLALRCKDTAKDSRGFIVALTDEDVISLIESAKRGVSSHAFPLLARKFHELIQ